MLIELIRQVKTTGVRAIGTETAVKGVLPEETVVGADKTHVQAGVGVVIGCATDWTVVVG